MGHFHRNLPAFLLLVLVAALPAPAGLLAQETAAASMPEEIIVNAPESLIRLRQEVFKAEDNLYDIYNSLNQDDKFDIKCGLENVPGSRMQVRVCRPAYYNTAMEEDGEAYHQQLSGLAGGTPAAPDVYSTVGTRTWNNAPGTTILDHYNAQMDAKLRAVIAESPEFIEAVREYNIIKENYEAIRAGRFGE